MAGQKYSQLTPLVDAVALDDFIHIVDKSDTAQSPAGSSKKVDISALKAAVTTGGRYATVTFSDTTKNIGVPIPAGTVIDSCWVKVTTPFDTGTLTVGDSSDPTGYANLSSGDINAIQRVISDGAAYCGAALSATSQAVVTISGAPTTGEATIVITTVDI